MEGELIREEAQIERKLFSFSLRQNDRGKFLRITEDVGGRRDTVIVPAAGLRTVCDILERAIKASAAAEPAPAGRSKAKK